MSTSCANVRTTARTNRMALRRNRGIAKYTPRSVGVLGLNVPSQIEKLSAWRVEAIDKNYKGPLEIAPTLSI